MKEVCALQDPTFFILRCEQSEPRRTHSADAALQRANQ
jgi:hypothetical protein